MLDARATRMASILVPLLSYELPWLLGERPLPLLDV